MTRYSASFVGRTPRNGSDAKVKGRSAGGTQAFVDWARMTFPHLDVQVVDLALSGALDVTDRFSIGAGLIFSQADVTLMDRTIADGVEQVRLTQARAAPDK